MSRTSDFGNRPAWAGFLLLPPALFLTRLAVDLHAAGSPAVVAGGALCGGLAALAVGPHFSALGAIFGLALGHLLTLLVDAPWPSSIVVPLFGWASFAGLLGSMGVSAGGGAPGLRYATSFSAFAAWVLVPPLVVPLGELLQGHVGAGGIALSIAAGAPVLVAGLVWWITKRHPRPATADSTQRVAPMLLIAVLVLMAIYGSDVLRGAGGHSPWFYRGAAWATASVVALLALVLQLVRSPCRMGALAGVGCMLASLAEVWAWSSKSVPSIGIDVLAGIAHGLVIPWAWARATSDTHWRLAALFGVAVLLVPLTPPLMGPLLPVALVMALAIGAIPIGALSWYADDWIYGDVPGSDPSSWRGRR